MSGDYAEEYGDIGTVAGENQFLTFLLAGEEYGIDIHKIQELRGWESVTHLPQAPAYIKGVINLRGDIVPIVDLRERFGQQVVPYGERTVVVVIKVPEGGNTHTMGIVVDAVSDVVTLGGGEMRPPPDFCSVVHTEYVRGLATIHERMLILLDSDRLMRPAGIALAKTLVT